MRLSDILTPGRVRCSVQVNGKKRALEILGEVYEQDHPPLDGRDIFKNLMERERLGSTGLGKGVAIPHARLPNLTTMLAAFLQLERAIDYDSIDDEPVDLMFALLVPAESTHSQPSQQHLDVLAMLAEMLSDADFREHLRKAPDEQAKFDLLVNWESSIVCPDPNDLD